MRRREFITLLGGTTAAWPLAARAQQAAMLVIGFLNGRSRQEYARQVAAFHRGIGELGFVEGQNAAIEYRWAEGDNSRLSPLAADLVRRNVAVIAAVGSEAIAHVAKAATTTIPIVFNSASDPVKAGLVASLARPGGNLTGVSRLTTELVPKRIEILHDVVPAANVIGCISNQKNPLTTGFVKEVQEASRSLGLETDVSFASTLAELDMALSEMVKRHIGAVIFTSDGYFNDHSEQIGALTRHHKLPAIYQVREFAAGGGLMSYGSSLTDALRMVGVYVGQILKGAKPADLPVQQQSRIEFVVNLKTADALGLTIPLPLVGRADEVIE